MKFKFILLLAAISFGTAAPAFALHKAGDQASDFSARTLDDQSIKLSDFKGQTLLIEMGTTWCPSCNELAHQIDGMREVLSARGITYISVFLGDPANSIRAHLKEEGLKPANHVLIDEGDARRNYSIFSIPRLILIDKDFRIVFDEMILGAKELKKRIENLPVPN